MANTEKSDDLIDDAEHIAGDGTEDGKAVAKTPVDPQRARKKKILLAAAGAVLLLGGGGASYVLIGGKSAASHGAAGTEATAGAAGDAAGHATIPPLDVPPILVNLRSADGAPHFLKLHVMLVPGTQSNAEALKTDLPVLLDAYQPFLRELRPEDLSGSAAVFRIKEELLIRARATIGADKVGEVLIQDLVQQ